MSSHPNVLLIAVVTPATTSRATMRAIMDEAGCQESHDTIDPATGKKTVNRAKDGEVALNLNCEVMESDYYEDWQISAKEGDLLFFDMITYGYGEFVTWDVLSGQKALLETWCKGVCERHNCTFEIRVSANHW
ncbi:MAG: hypothetical protein ABFE07_23510 [Armatimonadia bacterium]